MYGQGILRGLGITLSHLFKTYFRDIRYAGNKYLGQTEFELRQGMKAQGIYTVQYPDEKVAVPERFRFTPFLVVEDADHPERPGHDWCTSCGICAKVCPPQCIWIVRGEDSNTKRPIPEPEAFYIDIDICMNCGYCAEFCPFDAIKMDHDYEMASYDRTTAHIHDKERLSKPFSYWLNIAPTTAHEEAEARGSWEHSDVMKAKKKAGVASAPFKPVSSPTEVMELIRETIPPAPPAAAAPAASAETSESAPAGTEAAAAAATDADAAKAERLRKREEALARKRAREAGGE
jgi:NADH-quinone oxidoreductase subunit I